MPRARYRLRDLHGCGDFAFYLLERPRAGDVIAASNVRYSDGRAPPDKSSAWCASCSRTLQNRDAISEALEVCDVELPDEQL